MFGTCDSKPNENGGSEPIILIWFGINGSEQENWNETNMFGTYDSEPKEKGGLEQIMTM